VLSENLKAGLNDNILELSSILHITNIFPVLEELGAGSVKVNVPAELSHKIV